MLNNFIENKTFGIDSSTWNNQVIPAISLLIIEKRFEEELQGMLEGIEARAREKVYLPSLG